MDENNCQGFIVSHPANMYYLSGFSGEGVLFIDVERQIILTDGRYLEAAAAECPGFEARQTSDQNLVELSGGSKKVGIESTHVTYQRFQTWQRIIGEKLQPQAALIEQLRSVKDESEIDLIREAVHIGDQVYLTILPMLQPGISERAVALEIDHQLKLMGCDKEAFETIVISGRRTSMPHGKPSEKEIEKGELVTMDFGGFYRCYAGDMTRTVAVGKSCSRTRSMYGRVLEAQLEAIATVEAGRTCREVDEAARRVFKKYELDSYFLHSTGHGLGLEIHEMPAVSSRSETVLKENMVITIEPGVYLQDWGGVRIEDVVLVKSGGHQVLTKSGKDLVVT